MTHKEKSTGLLALIAKGLLLHAARTGEEQLGDRSAYLGMSDIGRGIDCLRAAVAGKLYHSFEVTPEELEELNHQGDTARVMQALRRQITLQRGHWLESGIGKALTAANVNFLPQLEIEGLHGTIPIKAHLDMTLVWGGRRPAVRILELKSTGKMRDSLFTSHETQVYAQLGMLKKLWNSRCFNWRDENGVLHYGQATFPGLMRAVFKIDLPEEPEQVDIEGWVVSVSPDDARVFGPYQPDPCALNVCMQVAGRIWNHLSRIREGKSTLEDVPHHKGFHPLCDWCDHNSTCPKFKGMEHPEYEQVLWQREALKEQSEALKSELEDVEMQIKNAYGRITSSDSEGEAAPGDWILSGASRFRVSVSKGRTSLDENLLRSALHEVLTDASLVEDIIAKAQKTSEPSSRLYIGPVNKPARKPKKTPATAEETLPAKAA